MGEIKVKHLFGKSGRAYIYIYIWQAPPSTCFSFTGQERRGERARLCSRCKNPPSGCVSGTIISCGCQIILRGWVQTNPILFLSLSLGLDSWDEVYFRPLRDARHRCYVNVWAFKANFSCANVGCVKEWQSLRRQSFPITPSLLAFRKQPDLFYLWAHSANFCIGATAKYVSMSERWWNVDFLMQTKKFSIINAPIGRR